MDIGNAILKAIRTLLFNLCETVYSLICFCFDIFKEMGTARLDIDVDIIFQRVSLVLGLFMVFCLTFSAISYLIDPDKITDKQKGIGNIIKKVLLVVVLLGTTNYLFKEAYKLQERLLESQIIEKIILPGFNSNENNNDNQGVILSWYVFNQFYKCNSDVNSSINCDEQVNNVRAAFEKNRNMSSGYIHLNDQDTDDNFVINFNGFIALVVGVVLLWIIVSYTVQAGIRVIQLAYLEIIAPIPIMMYLMPNGNDKLKKWGQQCLTTFLDFFIRLAIMDFVILVAITLCNSESNFINNFSAAGFWEIGYINVIMIIAIFMFAKKVPELLKELFPSTGGAAGFGFGIKGPKAVWNAWKAAPVLGLGAKAIGWTGKQTKNLVNKPIQARKDKTAEIRKARKQANTDTRTRKEQENKGRELYNRYGETLPSTEFKNQKYRDSYNNVASAKKEADKYENDLYDANAAYQAAYNSGDANRIEAARTARELALKKNKAAQSRLEIAKQNHENMKKIYVQDAKIEDSYKYYKDLNPQSPNQNQQQQTMSPEEAAQMVNDRNASYEDQIRAAETLDAMARERNNNQNNNHN